jgi:hypothetical protein
MTSRTRSQAWALGTLSFVLAALLLDTPAHEPRLSHQIASESRAGVQVAHVGFRTGMRHAGAAVGTVASKVGRMLGRVQWGARK